jgi:hypothetical protein
MSSGGCQVSDDIINMMGEFLSLDFASRPPHQDLAFFRYVVSRKLKVKLKTHGVSFLSPSSFHFTCCVVVDLHESSSWCFKT